MSTAPDTSKFPVGTDKYYSELISIPPKSAINTGFSPPSVRQQLAKFGVPGRPTKDCSDVTNKILAAHMVYGVQITPYIKLSGFENFITRIRKAFAVIKTADLALYTHARTAGALCCRVQRGTDPASGVWSNHAFGCSGDFYFGDEVDPRGDGKCQRGLLMLYPYFYTQGLYWGAEYGGSAEDSMHWDLSAEALSMLKYPYM
jgi:hypothetical protein